MKEFTKVKKYGRISPVIGMKLDKSMQQSDEKINFAMDEYEYKSKFGFLNELQNAVRTDEEYAKYKGNIK